MEQVNDEIAHFFVKIKNVRDFGTILARLSAARGQVFQARERECTGSGTELRYIEAL